MESITNVTGPSPTISTFMYCPNAPGLTFSGAYIVLKWSKNLLYRIYAASFCMALWKSGFVPFSWWYRVNCETKRIS